MRTILRQLVAIFFGTRRVALMSSLFGIAIICLLFIAYEQTREAVRIELPTGISAGTATKKAAAPAAYPREVLVINSYHVGHAWSDNELAGIIEAFRTAPSNINCLVEYLDCKHHPKHEHFEQVKKLFKVKYGGRDIPVVIVTDNPAFEFVLKYRSQLFPRSSIVFCGVNDFNKEMIAGQRDITGLAEVLDSGDTIKTALKLHPATKEVFVVHDYTTTGLATRREAEEQLKELSGRITVRFPEEMTQQELTQFLRSLPGDSLVLALAYNVFKDGKVIAHEDLAQLLSENSPVPVYGVHRERLGYGIVGGSLLGGKLHGMQAAGITLKILSGTPASAIPVVVEPIPRLMFDHNQLVRFGIPINALPEGSVIVNRPVSFISANRHLVISMLLMFALLATGIVMLGFNVSRRLLAEEALRRSNEELEERIAERSAELRNANEQLQLELTERMVAEEALRKSEQELRKAQRLALIGSWDWDAVNDTIWWSDEYYRLYGLDPNKPTPNYVEHLQVYTPESAARLDAAVKQAMETGEPYELDLELATPTPSTQWIVARGEAKRDASGKISGLRGTAQNITERKRAEEEIGRVNEELEKRVKQRTAELEEKIAELHKVNRLFVGRELRMVELKDKIRALETTSGAKVNQNARQ